MLDQLDRPFLAISGPTAVGKTALALSLAERLGAEIVSVDSRQVYRGLDIGTSTPTAEELERVPHHFVNEKSPDERFSAGQFGVEAHQRILEILDRGRVPLAVGGSTLYLEALVHGLSDLPAVPIDLELALVELAGTPEGRATLFRELKDADPQAAATLDETKTHRLIRFVGVYRSTGIKPSETWQSSTPPPFRFKVIILNRPREVLYRRIEDRIEEMLLHGLLDENRQLRGSAEASGSPLLRTIGYHEPQSFLSGDISESEMIRLLKRNTRRYAKRQLTWFRRRASNIWLDAETATIDAVLRLHNER